MCTPIRAGAAAQTLSRRALVLACAAMGGAAMTSMHSALADTSAGATRQPLTVDTIEGRLRGWSQAGVCQFRGVRYAEPPVGPARFAAPLPLATWTGERDAQAWGRPALQAPGQTFGINEPSSGEDCLVLNIWSPAVGDGRRRPVMFYCHGGGFWTGSAASVHQDGTNLAREHDVVVVQCNHRLGIMGYLFLGDLLGERYAQAANPGLLDIVAALAWTRRNIAAFGGDPDNVMVWGESGGGAKTSCIYAMPAAAPLFHKASIESGPGVRMTDREVANRTTRWVLDRLGLAPSEARRLLEVPAAKLLEVQLSPPPNSSMGLLGGRRGIGASGVGGFSPVVDGLVLPTHPFDPAAPALSADKPLMVGWNRDEIVFFHMFNPDKSVFALDEAGLVQRVERQFGPAGAGLLSAYRRSRPDASPSAIAIAIESAAFAGAGATVIAERKAAQQRAPVFAYMMTDPMHRHVPGTAFPMGAMHAMDIRLKFNNLDPTEAQFPSLTQEERAEHQLAARNMSQMWASFARSGRPSALGQPEWPAYTLQQRATMMIAAHCSVATDPYQEERLAWARMS